MRYRKKEKIGEKDEGVFGIRPGTSITIAIKNLKPNNKCKLYYSEQWGLRSKKFNWLESHDIEDTDWSEIYPSSPFYFLVAKDEKGWETYRNFVSVKDIFIINSSAIVTARDNFAIDFDRSAQESKIRIFLDINNLDPFVKEFMRSVLQRKKIEDVENYSWRVSEARSQLRKSGSDLDRFYVKIDYRPFDDRWIFYHSAVVWRMRDDVMKHMLRGDNLALVTCRQLSKEGFSHVFVSNKLVDDSFVSNRSRERGYVFPLYINNNQHQQTLIDDGHRGQNINWKAIDHLSTLQGFDSKITGNYIQPAEAIFYYIYAVLYSNIYRKKYQEFLKSDFPRIPFTNDYELFKTLALLGEQLVQLHLLKSKLLDNPASRYEGKGDSRVEKRNYDEESNRVYINSSQFFDKVTPGVWNYYIGGYQVLDKWLKDRNERVLSLEDQFHFRKVITALSETINIQKKIDKFYPNVENNLLVFN